MGEIKMNYCKTSVDPFLKYMCDGCSVEWKGWTAEALKSAVNLDRPICLCVVNSHSRWSNAMKENFNHSEIISMLNNDFVSIMVDADDVPDLTLAARAMAQIMLGHAGWPLFLFMMPDKRPVFASSYMPQSGNSPQFPGLLEVLRRIKWLWLMKRPELTEAAKSFQEQLCEALSPFTASPPEDLADRAARQLLDEFDPEYGGFGSTPKFPQASKLLLAMRFAADGLEKEKFAEHVQRTLSNMYRGALYDRVGGGFHDYCADKAWKRPYFGKHLAQNVALLDVYLTGYLDFKLPFCRSVLEKGLKAIEKLSDGQGLFLSGEDISNSNAVDANYLWDYDEIKSAWGADSKKFLGICGIMPAGNYCDPLTGKDSGKNVLLLAESDEEALEPYFEKLAVSRAEKSSKASPALDSGLDSSIDLREKRISVGDNAACATLLAKVSRAFEYPAMTARAEKIIETLMNRAYCGGALCHSIYGANCVGEAVLDDVANLAQACVELYLSTYSQKWLNMASTFCYKADELFGADGAFGLVSKDSEKLVPAWDAGDGVAPSGNAVMLDVLTSLYELDANPAWKNRANKIVEAFGGALCEYPTACAALVNAALRLKDLDKN